MCVSDSLDPSKETKNNLNNIDLNLIHILVLNTSAMNKSPQTQQGSSHDKKTTHGNYTILKSTQKSTKRIYIYKNVVFQNLSLCRHTWADIAPAI